MTRAAVPFAAIFAVLAAAAALLAGTGAADPGLVGRSAAFMILRARGVLQDTSILGTDALGPVAIQLTLGWLPDLGGPLPMLLASAAAGAAAAAHAGRRAAVVLGGWRGWAAVALVLLNPLVLAGLAAGRGLLLAAVYASLVALRAAAAAPGSKAPAGAALVIAAGLLMDRHYALMLPVLLPALVATGGSRTFARWGSVARQAAVLWFPAAVTGALAAGAAQLGVAPTPDIAGAARPWLDLIDGNLALAFVIVAAATAAAAPLAVAGLVRPTVAPPVRAALRTAAIAVPVAAALATWTQDLAAPGELLVLAGAPALLMAGEPGLRRATVLGLLALGLLGGGLVVAARPPMPALMLADRLRGMPPAADPAYALGQWLQGKDDVLIDPASAAAVIVARGTAAGLVTDPPTPDAGHPPHRYVVVSDPRADRPDRVAWDFPGLFAAGAPGYRLATAAGPWRVYEEAK